MLVDIFFLIAGLLLIIKGGDLFVGASIRIAEYLQMPRVVIGSTLVSLATTTPELVVSIISGLEGKSGLAVGNAVGSCICNMGLILGFSAILRHIEVHPRTLRVPLIFMVSCGVLVFLMTLNLSLVRWQGGLLFGLGIGYFIYDFRKHMKPATPNDVREALAIENEETAPVRWVHSPKGAAAVFAFGALLVIVGSRLLVDGAVGVATAAGVPSIVIGLTVVAIGTSLPELVTAITSARKQVTDLSIGNLFGANIANLTLIVGTAAGLNDLSMDRVTQLFNFPALLVGMGLMAWVLHTDRRVTRREGVFMIGYYAVYLALITIMTAMSR